MLIPLERVNAGNIIINAAKADNVSRCNVVPPVNHELDFLGCLYGHSRVTNSRKALCRGITAFGFCSMSKYTLGFLDHNPKAEKRPYIWLNNPQTIARNDNVVSVNSAIQIDLSGQVCAESIGLTEFSGTGGQADFVRGAKWSRGGKSFIAMKSSRTDKNGQLHSKISLSLPLGSSVTTPKSDVHYIVTEYGVADLRGRTLADRARLLIGIAHPDFRDSLSFEARKAGIML